MKRRRYGLAGGVRRIVLRVEDVEQGRMKRKKVWKGWTSWKEERSRWAVKGGSQARKSRSQVKEVRKERISRKHGKMG